MKIVLFIGIYTMKTNPSLIEPPRECNNCSRLVSFRSENKHAFPEYYNGAVNNIGSLDSEIMVLGLAPGLQGANKSGMPFIGDNSGDLLYECLGELGYTTGNHQADIHKFKLKNILVTNAVRCVPPQNKPTANEIKNCRPFLLSLIENMPNLRVIFALGKVAHDTALKTFNLPLAQNKFGHGTVYSLNSTLKLVSSYHCSRYNINTKVLTKPMFLDVLNTAKAHTL